MRSMVASRQAQSAMWTGRSKLPLKHRLPGAKRRSGSAVPAFVRWPMRFRHALIEVLPLEAADTGNTIGSLDNDIFLAKGYLNFVAGLGIEIKG